MSTVLDKFLRYVKIDTQSQDGATTVPSTDKQRNLASLLAQELNDMGAQDVVYDKAHCYVYATIPSNLPEGKTAPVIGFISHMDTSPAVSGENVNPRVVAYEGGDIILNAEKNIVLTEKENPELAHFVGKHLIVTDGNTLLGADDKAGVAEIMTMAQELLSNKNLVHGKIRIGFTPDEEVGCGVDFFDVEGFGADYAYTVDGGAEGEIEYENFNACEAVFTIRGVNVHPGSAKGIMINAGAVGCEIQMMLPQEETPEQTEGYEGFYHLIKINGSCERAELVYIVRDHDADKFAQKQQKLKEIADAMNQKYGAGTVDLQIREQYRNMAEKIRPCFHLIENAKKACEQVGVVPKVQPIRGGTDGARLSFMGLPCPNLGTGGYAFHGPYEHITAEGMDKSTAILVELIKQYSR